MRPIVNTKPIVNTNTNSGAAKLRIAKGITFERLTTNSTYAALAFAILMSLAAQISIPVPGTEVPMTFQSTVVLILGFSLPPFAAGLSMIAYLAAGAAGLPVFSPSSHGIFGSTGGYLVGFLFAAVAISTLKGRGEASWSRLMLSGFAGLAVLFAFGLAWRYVYANILNADAAVAISTGLIPFLPKAIAELLLVVGLKKGWKQFRYC